MKGGENNKVHMQGKGSAATGTKGQGLCIS
jgi:hypothetical protein